MANIYDRWGIPISDEQQFSTLKSRLKILAGDNRIEVTKLEAQLVAFGLGIEVENVAHSGMYDDDWYLYLGELIGNARSPFELAHRVETLVNNVTAVKNNAGIMMKVINASPCGIHFKKIKSTWISYPSGEKMLDEELVDQPLSFLSDKVLKEYKKALDHYGSGQWEESAEKTRRALEEYLKYKLKNTKGLKANIEELGKKLGQTKAPQHLLNTLLGMLRLLDTHYNESSKHNSKVDGESEAEFLIYQVGLFMRILSKIWA